MIFLDYNLDPTMGQRPAEWEIISADHSALDFRLFCGDIYFRIDDANFDAWWSWIPVIHFSMQLAEITCTIRDGETAAFEFTESENKLWFSRTKEVIDVTSDYSNAHGQTSLTEIRSATVSFARKVVDDLISRWPLLEGNIALHEKMVQLMRYTEQCR